MQKYKCLICGKESNRIYCCGSYLDLEKRSGVASHQTDNASGSTGAVCYKQVSLCASDILNLKYAAKRIIDTGTSDYEPLELSTIQGIIKQFETGSL